LVSELAVATKRCSKCGEVKPLSEFYNDRTKADGKASWCKTDDLASQRRSNQRRRESIGDKAFKEEQRERTRRHRASGKDTGLDRKAYRKALWQLKANHQTEFTALLRVARYELGLDPDGHSQPAP
jgi:hypothetical protein